MSLPAYRVPEIKGKFSPRSLNVGERYREMKAHRTVADLQHHAYMGDRQLGLIVALHIEKKFYVMREDRRNLSDHQLSLYYVTSPVLSACFDYCKLERPAPGNPDFCEHTKANKVEQFISLLDMHRDICLKAEMQLCAVLHWVLQEGDRRFDLAKK
jgi:hypothetical protein